MMRDEFCGWLRDHIRHTYRPRWRWYRRRCTGAFVITCGDRETHAPHWGGEFGDELCQGAGLAGVCVHGVGMLDHCRECHPALGA